MTNKIAAEHLARRACVYIRQSTPDQVQHNLESQRRQYALVERARTLGWQDIDVIDDDLGISGSGTRRPGFERLLRALCDGQIGAVFSIEASRLARNGRDWHTLLEFCSVVGALLIDAEAVYDPTLTNDRLLLGMKGTISEMEVANFRERAQAAILQKAQRGALVRRVPIGYVKGSDDRIEKDPDVRIRSTIDLIFRKFAELSSVRQVYFWLDQQRIQLPVARGTEELREVIWSVRSLPRGARCVEKSSLRGCICLRAQ
jgi:DNA invertase Pin-like site-specific DNA recombinase